MWRQLLVAAAISSSAIVHVLAIDGCAPDLFPVSVLDVPEVQCVTSTPCSGTYSSAGLPQGVGACPTSTGCALLPNSFIMGCVAEGRADITYVNADGTLTKAGKVVTMDTTTTTTTSTAPTTATTDSATSTTTGSTTTTTTTTDVAPSIASSTAASKSEEEPTPSATSSTTTEDGNAATTAAVGSSSSGDTTQTTTATSSTTGSSATSASTPTPSNNNTTASTADSESSSDSDSGSDWSSESDSFSTSTDGSVIESGSEEANQQNSWREADIASDGTNSISNGTSSTGMGIGTIIAIVVGCLAVVAIAAGARLLKKGKEGTELTTPEGNLDNYGGGMTPKENVLLL